MSMTETQTEISETALNAKNVAAWLRSHPDFLLKSPDLLEILTPPQQQNGEAIRDFQHFMLKRLQDDNQILRKDQDELVSMARANLSNQHRIFEAVTALFAARSMADLVRTITHDLPVILDVDVVAMVVESNGHDLPHVHRSGVRVVPPGRLIHWLGHRASILNSHIEADMEIYGPAATLVKSEALLRLSIADDTPEGLLAFGSRDPEMFGAGQATDLVSFLGRCIALSIRARLDIGET